MKIIDSPKPSDTPLDKKIQRLKPNYRSRDGSTRNKHEILKKEYFWYNPNTGEVRLTPFTYPVKDHQIITRLITEVRYQHDTSVDYLWFTLWLVKRVHKLERAYTHYFQYSYDTSNPSEIFDIKEWDSAFTAWYEVDAWYNAAWADDDDPGIRDNQITIGTISVTLYDSNKGFLPDFNYEKRYGYKTDPDYDPLSDIEGAGSLVDTKDVLAYKDAEQGESTIPGTIKYPDGKVVDPLRLPDVSSGDLSISVRAFKESSTGDISIGYGTSAKSYTSIAEHMYVTKDMIVRAGFVSSSGKSSENYSGWITEVSFKPLHEVDLHDGERIVRGSSGMALIRLVTGSKTIDLTQVKK